MRPRLPERAREQSTERYRKIVKLSDFGAERNPAELMAAIASGGLTSFWAAVKV